MEEVAVHTLPRPVKQWSITYARVRDPTVLTAVVAAVDKETAVVEFRKSYPYHRVLNTMLYR